MCNYILDHNMSHLILTKSEVILKNNANRLKLIIRKNHFKRFVLAMNITNGAAISYFLLIQTLRI